MSNRRSGSRSRGTNTTTVYSDSHSLFAKYQPIYNEMWEHVRDYSQSHPSQNITLGELNDVSVDIDNAKYIQIPFLCTVIENMGKFEKSFTKRLQANVHISSSIEPRQDSGVCFVFNIDREELKKRDNTGMFYDHLKQRAWENKYYLVLAALMLYLFFM